MIVFEFENGEHIKEDDVKKITKEIQEVLHSHDLSVMQAKHVLDVTKIRIESTKV